ncbi:unnamed protein product [Schistosoma curassoni]|uniref:Ovule protein n=1 Tax=Schistosoma curassoni TaxID=6186 RepID=A0A183KQ68_9TREM|nr:unnamed protein product [Schistosoma curassoni]
MTTNNSGNIRVVRKSDTWNSKLLTPFIPENCWPICSTKATISPHRKYGIRSRSQKFDLCVDDCCVSIFSSSNSACTSQSCPRR